MTEALREEIKDLERLLAELQELLRAVLCGEKVLVNTTEGDLRGQIAFHEQQLKDMRGSL